MLRPTMICDAGDVVIVPFPFVDHPVVKIRPALVLSVRRFNADEGQSLLAMITTAARSHWTSDCPIRELEPAGLKTASVVRLKLFTFENAVIGRRLGSLADQDFTAVRVNLDHVMLRRG